MALRLAADGVLLLHAAFILFVLLGAALSIRWRWIPLVHLPAVAWGIFVEVTGRVCPLTPLENSLRARAGESGYRESFVEHYILDVLYPGGLTSQVQWTLAGIVLGINLLMYGWLLWRWQRRRPVGRD